MTPHLPTSVTAVLFVVVVGLGCVMIVQTAVNSRLGLLLGWLARITIIIIRAIIIIIRAF